MVENAYYYVKPPDRPPPKAKVGSNSLCFVTEHLPRGEGEEGR